MCEGYLCTVYVCILCLQIVRTIWRHVTIIWGHFKMEHFVGGDVMQQQFFVL
jgi:hypothetical protein